jgi:hypothetical protein
VAQLSQFQDSSIQETHDANGVDRTLIRKMLRLTPEERLNYIEGYVEELTEVWELNGTRPVR